MEPHITQSESKVLDYSLRALFSSRTILTSKKDRRFVTSWIISGAFVACLVWSILTASVGWNNTLSDQHGFRQTQTAITSYYLMLGGPFLSYETPVLGRPWSIPFEFPLYQGIVALASTSFKTPLNQTGRFISEIFFYLSLLTFWFLLAELNIGPVYRLVFLSLALVSPQYVFWSRTFMIESTALFFCTGYLLFACRYARNHSLLAVLLGGAFGIIGALVKATTMAGFVLVAGVFYVYTLHNQSGPIRTSLTRNFIAFLFLVCLPVLTALAWTHYADEVRSQNVIGILTTSSALKEWTFGSFSQRFSSNTWKILFDRIIPDLLGGNVILLLPLLGICLARERLFPFLTCILGFLSAFLIFTNLHVLHNYYAYANGIFLIAAVSCAVVGLLEQKNWAHLLGIVIFFAMIFVSVKGYYKRYSGVICTGISCRSEYYTIQKNNSSQLDNIAYTIKQMIPREEIILVFGEEWSSELPYYSERRALMWPSWMPQDMDSPIMTEALSKLSDTRVGALLVCNSARADYQLIKRATAVLKVAGTPAYKDDVCSLYPRDGADKRER